MSNKNSATLVRSLYIELAKQLGQSHTFKQIADLFFQYGVIDTPESPYGSYEGTKQAYALEKLSNMQSNSGLLSALPDIIYDSLNGISENEPLFETQKLELIMREVGYRRVETPYIDEEGRVWGSEVNYELPQDLQNLSIVPAPDQSNAFEPVEIHSSSKDIEYLVDELNDNLRRGNRIASALLIRRLLTLSCYLSLRKAGEVELLYDAEGNEVELSVALAKCATHFKISNKVTARLKAAKWIGDTANHSFRAKVSDSDIEVARTAVVLFLGELDL